MTDWSQCDVCNGTDIGHYCDVHVPQKISETRYCTVESTPGIGIDVGLYSGDAGDETAVHQCCYGDVEFCACECHDEDGERE